jgi:transposase-like protein
VPPPSRLSSAPAGLIELLVLAQDPQLVGRRVHFLRKVLARVPKGSAEMVTAAIRTIFAQSEAADVREQLDVVAGMLGGSPSP